jgi:hypothetical protein
MCRALRTSDNTTHAASNASSMPSSSHGSGAPSTNTPAYRWCWWLTFTHWILLMPVRHTHLSSAVSRIHLHSTSERKNVAIGEFFKSQMT